MRIFKINKISEWITSVLVNIASYRIKKPKTFILLESLVIGLITGLIAVLLKNIVHIASRELYRNSSPEHPQFLYFALPDIGILLTVLYLRTFIKDSLSHLMALVK